MAGLTLSRFVDALRESCDSSDLVISYDIRMPDNALLKTRVYLTIEAFIDVYYNPTNGNCSFTLVQDRQRIYGADNAFVGWHVHPFEDPNEHRLCGEVVFSEFLQTIEVWA